MSLWSFSRGNNRQRSWSRKVGRRMCECAKNDPTMTLAMLGAAALLVLWMIMRGGLRMSKGQATNILAVVVVAAVVAGAAWFKVQQSSAPAAEDGTSSKPAPTAQAVQPAPAFDPAVKEGELCPEPAPVSQPALAQTTKATNTQVAQIKLPRLVDLGAQSCQACKALAPILDSLREEYKGRLDVEFIDVWKNRNAGQPYGIRVIPTQILFDSEGKEVWRHEGFFSKADFKQLFAEKVGVK